MKLKGAFSALHGTAVVLDVLGMQGSRGQRGDEPCGSAGESLFDGSGASEHWPGTEMTAQIP